MFFFIRGYDVTYTKFKILQLQNFVKSDPNATKPCASIFLHKINKDMSQKQGLVLKHFGLRTPSNSLNM